MNVIDSFKLNKLYNELKNDFNNNMRLLIILHKMSEDKSYNPFTDPLNNNTELFINIPQNLDINSNEFKQKLANNFSNQTNYTFNKYKEFEEFANSIGFKMGKYDIPKDEYTLNILKNINKKMLQYEFKINKITEFEMNDQIDCFNKYSEVETLKKNKKNFKII